MTLRTLGWCTWQAWRVAVIAGASLVTAPPAHSSHPQRLGLIERECQPQRGLRHRLRPGPQTVACQTRGCRSVWYKPRHQPVGLAPRGGYLKQDAVDGLCGAYSREDAGELSSRARSHLGYITRLLEGPTTLAQHRELLVLAGRLAALLAWARYGAGDRPAARAACRMARQFAEQAGHGEQAAWSLEIAAWFALVEGRYADTAALAEAGMEHAGITSAGVQLALQSARGYARMGDSRAQAALRAGRAVLDRLPEPSQPGNHFAFDAAKFEFYVGTILTWVGTDDAAAEEHARYVVTSAGLDSAGHWPMRVAISELDLAVPAGRRGDLDEAVALGTAALGHRWRSAQLMPRAAELARDLEARYPGDRLAGSFAEALAGDRRALGPGVA